MNLLHRIFFPGVPYPAAVIVHFIYGVVAACVVGFVFFGWDGYGEHQLWTAATFGSVAIAVGFVVYLVNRR